MKRVQLRRLGDNTYRVAKLYETDRPIVGAVIDAAGLVALTDAGYLVDFTDANLPSNTGARASGTGGTINPGVRSAGRRGRRWGQYPSICTPTKG